MIRNIKALGLALVAVFAMSAVAASAAQAEKQAAFWADGYTATIDTTGGTQTFVTGSGEVSCGEVHGKGELKEESTSLTSTNVEFTNCTADGFFPATIDMNSCDFHFTAGTTTEAEPNTAEGSVDVKCTKTGDSITVTIYEFGCKPPHECSVIGEIHVKAQNGIGPIVYHNKTTEEEVMDVEATVEAANIHAEYEGSIFGESGTDAESEYTGSFTASGTNKFEQPTDTTITPLT